jgi:hypothetical protein
VTRPARRSASGTSARRWVRRAGGDVLHGTGYSASLAVLVNLKCKVTMTTVDVALKPAFDGRAEPSRPSSLCCFYDRAQRCTEADFLRKRPLPFLMRHLPGRQSK